MAEVAPLRLLAQDAEDLSVISAALQDAVAKIGDIKVRGQAPAHADAGASTVSLGGD
jgi:hypothetical protein